MAGQFLMFLLLLVTFVHQTSAACRLKDNAPENGYFINKDGDPRTDNVVRNAVGVEIFCNAGFYRHGSSVRECLEENGKLNWDDLTTECRDTNECYEGIYEEKNDEQSNSVSDSWSDSEGSILVLLDACHKDARCRNLPGSYECECKQCFIGDGKKCNADLTPCEELTEVLEHGRIYKSRGGNRISYVCDEDYRSTGIVIRTCECGTWAPDDEPTFCKFQGCPTPTSPENGEVFLSSLLYDKRIIYQCNENFVLHGPQDRVCRRSGEWSYYEPICKPAPTFVDVAEKFKDSFIDKVGSYSNTSAAGDALGGRLAANAVGLDIVFAFDASSSISYTDFSYGVDFANLLVDQFGVSYQEGGTRIAAVVFASGARIKFNFNDEAADEVDEVKAKIEEIQQELGGGTAMKEAFELIIGEVIPEMRDNAKRALFMMTDGESNDGNPAAAAKRLRDEDVEVFAVGIGAQVKRNELKSIANTPYTSHVFLIKSYSDLEILSEVISEKRVDFNRCGVAIDIDIKEAKEKEATSENYDVEIPNSWPWIASIGRKSKDTGFFRHMCGGTLICNQWVLTAASCVNRNGFPLRSNEIIVTLGQHNRSSDAEVEVQEKEVETIILADGFAKDTYGKDLALIKLKTPVVLASFVRTACMGNEGDYIQSKFDEDCYTVGWGARDPTNKEEDSLNIPTQLRVPVQLDNECKIAHQIEYGDNILCAGYRSDGKSACVGDTGGALVCLRYDDTWAIVGVGVPKSKCDSNGKYGLYTKPIGFTEWINTNTANCLDEHLNIFN